MIVKSSEEFKAAVLNALSFSKYENENYTLYTNKKNT
ncbi:hypothetical protein M918_14530 [Clostridium sp. BL8]|nr:hypothetical protein M918_14530 [Clostridium sp. BL8]